MDRISDSGVMREDARTTGPPPSPGAPAALVASAGGGYRTVAARSWRVAVVQLAAIAMELALIFEIFASLGAAGSTSTSTDQYLWLTSWLYQPLHVSTATGSTLVMELHYGYPPLLLWLALVTAFVLLARIPRKSRWVLKRAGASGAGGWSAADPRGRLRSSLHELGCSKRFVFSVHQRGLLVGGAVASLGVALIGAYTIIERTGAMLSGKSAGAVVSDLSVGLGPMVCLAAGALGVVASVAAWPWARQHTVLIRGDGTVEPSP